MDKTDQNVAVPGLGMRQPSKRTLIIDGSDTDAPPKKEEGCC
jgi:hypothetical protein